MTLLSIREPEGHVGPNIGILHLRDLTQAERQLLADYRNKQAEEPL